MATATKQASGPRNSRYSFNLDNSLISLIEIEPSRARFNWFLLNKFDFSVDCAHKVFCRIKITESRFQGQFEGKPGNSSTT